MKPKFVFSKLSLFINTVFLFIIRPTAQFTDGSNSPLYSQFDINSYLGLDDNDKLSTNKSSLSQNSHPLDRGPYFDISASKNVTALAGKVAHLNCRIGNLGNKTVSWIRHRDLHLLTVATSTYTSDQRFTCTHTKQTGDWTLQVKCSQSRDSGTYECQVSTTPPVGYTMVLSIVEPVTIIVGGPDLYINTGSTVNLTCVVKDLPEPPPLVRWTHNNQEINYDSPRGGVSAITEKGDITTSYLLIQSAKVSDSVKYTCSPSIAYPKSVNVHVLNGEHPAAVQTGAITNKACQCLLLTSSVAVSTSQSQQAVYFDDPNVGRVAELHLNAY